MKGSIKMGRSTVRDSSTLQMEARMLAHSARTRFMAGAAMCGLTTRPTMETGYTTRCKATGCLSGLTANATRDNSTKTSETDRVASLGETVAPTMGLGKQENSMAEGVS